MKNTFKPDFYVERTYLYKNSKGIYYAITGLEEDIANIENDCICEIDELIAYPVVELCNKGYITKYSCSGHGYRDIEAIPIDYDDQASEYNAIEIKYVDELGVKVACRLSELTENVYITFEDNIQLKSIPEGWYQKNNSIYYYIGNEHFLNPLEYYKTVLIGIEKLVKWINELDDYLQY